MHSISFNMLINFYVCFSSISSRSSYIVACLVRGSACHVLCPLPMTMTLSSSARMHRVYARVIGAADVTADADDSPAIEMSNRLINSFFFFVSVFVSSLMFTHHLLCSATLSHWDCSMGCKCNCQCHVSWPTR